MAESAYHTITIRVPVPAGSRAKQYPIIALYEKELDALTAKLPKGSEFKDSIIEPRDAPRVARKTLAERVAEGIAAEMAKHNGSARAA